LTAAVVASGRVCSALALGGADEEGYILGIWYRDFAVKVGYIACLPILLWAVSKSRRQGFMWRIAWAGFIAFALAIIGYVHFEVGDLLPPTLGVWYYEVALGFPICLLIAAVVVDLARGKTLDWWTTVTVFPVVLIWFLGIVLKFSAR
jgi:hypothetical protein